MDASRDLRRSCSRGRDGKLRGQWNRAWWFSYGLQIDSKVPVEGGAESLVVGERGFAPTPSLTEDDVVSGDRDSPILESAGRYDFLREGRVGRGLVVLAAPAVIREEPRSGREPILRAVVVAIVRGPLQVPVRFVPREAVAVLGLLVHLTFDETQRVEEGVSESHVREACVSVDFDQERHVIGRDAEAALGARDLGAEKRDPKAELHQEPMKGGIELVAKAPATVGDDFLEDSVPLENDRHAKVDVEVLEGNRAEMRGMKLPETFPRRAFRGLRADAGQIVLHVRQ